MLRKHSRSLAPWSAGRWRDGILAADERPARVCEERLMTVFARTLIVVAAGLMTR